MSLRQTFISFAVAALSTAAFPAGAAPSAEAQRSFCMFESFKVTTVGSLYTTEHQGRGADVSRFAGARVFLPAQPGLTPEWIQANLARHIAEGKAVQAPSCPLDVAGATATVTSAGTGFWIEITAKNNDGAKEILARALALVR